MQTIPDIVRQQIGVPGPYDPRMPVLTQSELEVAPGHRVHDTVACRWMTAGRQGVRLPSLRVHRNRVTTLYWFRWWLNAQRILDDVHLDKRGIARGGLTSAVTSDDEDVDLELNEVLGPSS